MALKHDPVDKIKICINKCGLRFPFGRFVSKLLAICASPTYLGFSESVCRGKGQNCGVFKKPKGENETSAGNENFPREGKFPPKESQNPRQKVTFPRRVIFPLEGHFPPSAQLSPISNALGLRIKRNQMVSNDSLVLV